MKRQPNRAFIHSNSLASALITALLSLTSYTALSTPPSARIENIPLGPDPTGLPLGLRAQAEPHLARSPKDPNLLLATFQEGRLIGADGGAFATGYAISVDGGLTWKRELMPHLTQGADGGPFDRATDPVAAFDAVGDLLLCSLGLKGTGSEVTGSVQLSRAPSSTTAFGAPGTIFASTDPLQFPDKCWITANTFPGTSSYGRLLATHTWYVTATNGVEVVETPIRSQYSDDGGGTWSRPQTISPSLCQGSYPVFLPGGAVAIAYWNYFVTNGARVFEQPEVVVSHDGGETFSKPRSIGIVSPHTDEIARSGNVIPSLATDLQRSVLHFSCQGRIAGVPRILYSRSIDLGQTWSPYQVVNDTPNRASVFNPAIAVSPEGQHVTILFYDKRHGNSSGNLVDAYLAESFDAGKTWTANRRLSSVSSDLSKAPLASGGRMLGDYQGMASSVGLSVPAVAVWIDTRNETPDPYCARVPRDRGATFATWRELRFTTTQLAQPGVSGPDADPDRDGLSNWIEYGLGLEPDRMEARPTLRINTPLATSASLEITYERMNAATDVQWSWQFSSDLVHWTEATPSNQTVDRSPRADLERVTTRFVTDAATPGPHRFYRLQSR